MNKRTRWIFAVLIVIIGIAVIVAAIVFNRQKAMPLEEQILAADQIELLGEAYPADGGSIAFFFRLPYRQPMALLVRNMESLGNQDFQEIWLARQGGFLPHIDVQPGSELESKLVALLQTATLSTKAGDFETPPKEGRTKWIIERIQNRHSKW